MNIFEAYCAIFFGALRMVLDDRREDLGVSARLAEEIIDAQEKELRSRYPNAADYLKQPLPVPVDTHLATLLIEKMYEKHLTEMVGEIGKGAAGPDTIHAVTLFTGLIDTLFQNRTAYAKRIVTEINVKH